MTDAILVLNGGSSSLKFSLYPAGQAPCREKLLCEGQIAGLRGDARLTAQDGKGGALVDRALGRADHDRALPLLLSWIETQFDGIGLAAAGHRVVHGGDVFTGPVLIDTDVMRSLSGLVPLAPLHQPHNLALIAALADAHPSLPQVACFDTAFHASQPEVARLFALPRALTGQGLRRYGFHGLSYEYVAGRLPELLGPQVAEGRIVVAHLGSGASLCALHRRQSVATTMGLTALDGLMMARRCGSIDPGLLLYLMQEKGMSAAAVSDLLYNQSGLLGVSGISDDMRELLRSEDADARRAVDLFVYRIVRELGSMAAALGGLDALIFTAGIGAHAPQIRARVCRAAEWLGVRLDEAANQAGQACISDSSISAWVVETDEDLMIARHTAALLAAARPGVG